MKIILTRAEIEKAVCQYVNLKFNSSMNNVVWDSYNAPREATVTCEEFHDAEIVAAPKMTAILAPETVTEEPL